MSIAITAGAGARSLHTPSMRRRVIAGTTIGNALEFFDFTVFTFLMLVIGPLFFPAASSYGQLLLTTATFGVGFLMRPVGGMLIGSYADRHGRRAAMTLTLWLMGLGCALIAAAPTYAQMGLAGPVMMVLARLIQGFAAGGEVGRPPRCWSNMRRRRNAASIPAGNSAASRWGWRWARWWWAA